MCIIQRDIYIYILLYARFSYSDSKIGPIFISRTILFVFFFLYCPFKIIFITLVSLRNLFSWVTQPSYLAQEDAYTAHSVHSYYTSNRNDDYNVDGTKTLCSSVMSSNWSFRSNPFFLFFLQKMKTYC